MRTLLSLLVLAVVAASCGNDGPEDPPALADEVVEALGEDRASCVTEELSTEQIDAVNDAVLDGEEPDETIAQAFETAVDACTQDEADEGTGAGASSEESSSAEEALDFFQGTEPTCTEHAEATGNPAPEPERFADATVVEQVDEGRWLVADGLGDRVIVDLDAGTVYSVEGPEGALPRAYSFGCPPDLFPGTLDH